MSDTGQIIDQLMDDVRKALEASQPARAEALVLSVLSANPDNAEAMKILAGLQFLKGEDAAAFELFREAAGGDLNDPEAIHGLASVMLRLGETKQAQKALSAALSFDPHHVPSLYDRARLLTDLGQLKDAVLTYVQVLDRQPNHFNALYNGAGVLVRRGSLNMAAQWYGQALKLRPSDAKTLTNLGLVYRLMGWADQGLKCQKAAFDIDSDNPMIRWNLATAYLAAGDYLQGFEHYEARLERRRALDPRTFTVPRWTGERLNGERVLLTAEQGMGDVIQFSRFVQAVRDFGGVPVLEVHRPLKPLFDAQPDLEVRDLGGDDQDVDLYAPLMSVPFLIKATLDSIERLPFYLSLPPGERPDLAAKPASAPSIGIVWRGNPDHEYNALRSFDLDAFLPLVTGLGHLVSLQADPTHAEKQTLATAGIQDAGSGFRSFADTARWIAALDMIVSVDTATLHLAGMLKAPALLVLNKFRDWRWLTKREDSPWYPTVTVLQSRRGEKGDGFRARVRQAINTEISKS